jgi:hypothetical protein
VKLLYTILACLFLASAAFAQADTPAAPQVEELYVAKDDGTGKAGEQVSEFATTDVPIYCVVLLDAQGKVTVKMNFVAVSVAGVKPDTKVVTASYTTKDGQNRVNFTGRPDGRWTAGKYRVDIFLDGKVGKNITFDIRASGGAATDNSSAKKFDAGPPKRKRSNRP